MASAIELRDIADNGVESQRPQDQDAVYLTKTGKRPVLKRRFGTMSILGFSCIILGAWEGVYITLGFGLANGGPAGLLWGFLIVWIGTLATFTSLAELASMAPTSGGQYHWVSILAPQSNQKLFSYITGWLTVCGWQAAVAASSYITGTLLQNLIELVDPSYNPKLWHGTLLFYGVVLTCILFNTLLGTTLPKIESVLLIIFILGFFATMIPLVCLAPHGNASFVFTTFLNEGGWNSNGTSFFVGLAGNAFAFLGADSAYHMSEEIQNAAVVVPRVILLSIFINGLTGFATFIAALFCIGDLNALLQTNFSYPFIEIFLQATNSVPGTAIMVSIIIVAVAALAIGSMASASRQLWAFARDCGVPAWRLISRVDPKTSIPTSAIVATTIFAFLLGLISIGSPVAFNDVISLTLASLYASYLIACGLLLWRRCSGSIKTLAELSSSDHRYKNTNLPGSAGQLVWGPFRVPGVRGILVNAFACAYLIMILIFAYWPSFVPVTPAMMNYSSLVTGCVAIFATFYYVIWGHRTYKGPVIDVDTAT